jgi:hypothetical protein
VPSAGLSSLYVISVFLGLLGLADVRNDTLVVEEVLAHGDARVIYSVGTSADLNSCLPGYWRASGSIANGELRFHLPVPDRPELTYQFAGETLSGTFKSEGRVKLTRVADLTQVGCGPKAGGLPPALPAAGPRDRLTAPELLASPGGR